MPAPQTPQRILLIKPSSLGDIVHALPVLAGLRASFPQAHIAWLIGSSFASLLEGHPLLDEVIPFDRRRYGRLWRDPRVAWEFAGFLRGLRRRRFDLVLDLQGLLRSGIMALASGAPRRIGFARSREPAGVFYTQRVACPPAVEHAVDRNVHLARAAGVTIERIEFPLALRDAERRDAARLLAEDGLAAGESYVAVLPGARWPSKRWSPQQFAKLIDLLQAERAGRCVLLGGAEERDTAGQIANGCASRPIDLVGRTSLRQLVALLAGAERVVCVDSGPMHIAAALGRPLVALFGPTNPARTGPYSPRARVVTNPVPCAPCYRRICPLGHQDCLARLGPQAVLERVRELSPAEAVSGAGGGG